ncbi:MAG: DUF58 domain-containing protein [Nitriliruptor sp.]|nr:MAG: DUF58 domain-containing protein [Nitriliruptor sp.]
MSETTVPATGPPVRVAPSGPTPSLLGAAPSAAERPRRGERVWWAGVLPVPTLRAAAVLAVAAVVSGLGPDAIGVVIPLVLVAIVLVADAWLAPAPWRIEVARDLPGVLPLDADGEVAWMIGNPTGRAVTVAIADELPPSLRAERRRVQVTVAPHGRVRATTAIHPERRGTFLPSEVTVRVRGPLGLVTRQAARHLPGRLEVHPRFRSRAEAELRIQRGRILEQGRRSARGRGGGTEFESLRDYVQGDEFRHLDAAASARVGHPVVRTYRAETDQTVLILLDTGRVVAGRVEGVPRLDHGMDAALALATVGTALGDRVGLLAYGGQVHRLLAPRREATQLRRLSRELHALEPELAESDHAAAIRTVRARFRRRALVVLVTDLAPEAVEATLVPALPGLVRDHRVIVASVRDPAIQDRLTAQVDGVDDAYAAAGAATVVAARARAASALRSMGVEIVDEPPASFASAVTDAYLETKARGGW